MIRAIRPTATADTPVEWLRGWNVAPNAEYRVDITPGASNVGVILFRGGAIVATGGCLPGTDQPVMLAPAPGQTLDRIDADLPWHMLISSPAGPASVTLAAMVDLPDEIHPVYQDDALALSRATGLIDHGTHITADITVTCPLGLGAGLGAVVAVPVDGTDVAGQVESITWTATPDGAIEQAVIRQHIPIAPAAPTPPPAPPVVADDTGATDAATATSGNVLANDDPGLSVVAVNGLSGSVGVAVDGSDGGVFTIAADGAWTFNPAGDFAGLTGSDTATTSVTYHASDGVGEAMATLTVTVSSGAVALWTPSEITTAMWFDSADASTITLNGSTASQWRDKSGNNRHAAQGTPAAQPTLTASGLNGLPVLTFDGGDNLVHGYTRASGSAASLFVVASIASGLTGYKGIFSTNQENAVGIMMLARGASNNWGTYSKTWQAASSSILGVGPKILEMIESSNGTGTYYKNGAADGTYGNSFGQTGCIGGDIGQQMSGYIAEMVYCEIALDVATRQKIEGYLAHKWGLSANLPSDHPYKSAPPTVTVNATRWTPAEITTACWLDASDVTTITLASSAVSQWADKSGNFRHVSQSTAANRPIIGSALNGLDTLSFDGSNDVLVSADNSPVFSSLSAFVVFRSTNVTLRQGVVNKCHPSKSGYPDWEWQFGIRHVDGPTDGKTNTALYGASVDRILVATSPMVNNIWAIECATYSPTEMSIFRNGSANGNATFASTLFDYGKSTENRFWVGARRAGLYHLLGQIAEVILVSGVTDTTTRQKIEGYLAHKWGLVAGLPPDHPYKSAAPTV